MKGFTHQGDCKNQNFAAAKLSSRPRGSDANQFNNVEMPTWPKSSMGIRPQEGDKEKRLYFVYRKI